VNGIVASVVVGIGALLSVPATAAGTSYPLRLTSGSRLIVDARVNGHSVRALLDSAAESTLIDRKAAPSLQVSAGTTVTGQGSGAEIFDAARLRIDIDGKRITVIGADSKPAPRGVALTSVRRVTQ
jgi:hypothetical protein